MPGKGRRLHGRSELAVVGAGLVTAAAGVAALLSDGALRIASLVALGVLVLYFVCGDVVLAISDERETLRNPHGNRASDMGRPVRVIEDFTSRNGASMGKVSLGGETWNARSSGGTLHAAGEELVVVGIDGLVLVVAPRDGR